jgi:hypothetical protein
MGRALDRAARGRRPPPAACCPVTPQLSLAAQRLASRLAGHSGAVLTGARVSGTTAGRSAGQLAGRPAGRLAGWLRTSVHCPAGELATTRWLAQSAGAMPKLFFLLCLWLAYGCLSPS